MEKAFISQHILHQHSYASPIALSVLRNPRRISLSAVVSATSAPARASSVTFEALERISRLSCEPLYAINASHSKQSFCPQETHNRKSLFSSILLKHGRQFNYWNQPLNMGLRVCYLDCHEAGLCCYLLIHITAVYFHMWPIYWLSLVVLF
jgi:hypothetical protein